MAKLALAFDVTANTGQASRSLDRLGDKVERTGRRVGGLTGTIGRPLLALAGAGGVGALIGSSVKLAATFETTMRQVAVATDTPAGKLKDLNSLALKLGADTTFSAQQAGNAMLELAKGGLTAAQIKGGALASTLTLAAAGGLELGQAAGFVVQGLTTFSLGADKAATVAAALAGGANASTASVQDMGLALSQVGPGATQAGLSLQETTAVLAAFAQNGIKGSDAGTSLKTMLTRLIPTTDSAQAAMEAFGLKFTDAKGNIDDVTVVAQKLQDRLSKLSDEQRTSALATIFGSDATRAASILMKEGAAGIRRYIEATSDLTQAEKLAKAATDGTGGALEQMRGSIETAQIALGTALAPVVVDVAKKISAFANGPLTQDIIPAIGSFVKGMQDGTGPGGKFADVVGELGDAAGAAWGAAKPLFGFIGDHPKLFGEVAKDALIFAGAMKALSLVRGIRGGVAGVVGSATGAAPIPVLVTNPGFGTPGAPGSTGKGTPPAVAAGKLALPAAFLGLVPDVRDSRDVINQIDDALVRLVATQVLNAATKGLVGKDKANEILKATQRGQLVQAYDFLVKYGEKTDDVKNKIAELAKDPRVAAALKERAAQADRTVRLISGGFLAMERQAKLSSDQAGLWLGNGIGSGAATALLKAERLDGKLTIIGQKKVAPKVDVRNLDSSISGLGNMSELITRLNGRSASVKVNVIASGSGVTVSGGSLMEIKLADGGLVRGAGTGRSDSIPARLSNGEFVVNAKQTARYREQLEAINAGQTPALASAGGGQTVYVTVAKNETAMAVPMALRQDAWLRGF